MIDASWIGRVQNFLFGFTFIVWDKFLKQIGNNKLANKLENSFLLHGGGWKKLERQKVSNEAFNQYVFDKLGSSTVRNYYGMIEQTGSIYLECGHGNLHAPKGSHALIRRLNDFSIAEHGELGVIQLFSDIQKSYPGHSILTEDIGYTLPSKACVCGHEGVIVKVDGRLESAEVRGCSDAIYG